MCIRDSVVAAGWRLGVWQLFWGGVFCFCPTALLDAMELAPSSGIVYFMRMMGISYGLRGFLLHLLTQSETLCRTALQYFAVYNILPAVLVLLHADLFAGWRLWSSLAICVAEASFCCIAGWGHGPNGPSSAKPAKFE
eukprot:TRINITY_DN8145_c0_g1_i16.p1 TRINITY_DN8145_c0_g1~~TRINITY_DN8145_c0_g1_i16.p1  ORF type:complete len:138 (+),score=34.39 TRINITY_DN8145_c0_g1_i16:77-490(+)